MQYQVMKKTALFVNSHNVKHNAGNLTKALDTMSVCRKEIYNKAELVKQKFPNLLRKISRIGSPAIADFRNSFSSFSREIKKGLTRLDAAISSMSGDLSSPDVFNQCITSLRAAKQFFKNAVSHISKLSAPIYRTEFDAFSAVWDIVYVIDVDADILESAIHEIKN